MKYTFIVHKEENGYWAEHEKGNDSCNIQGDNLSEILEKAKEIIELMYEDDDITVVLKNED